MGLRCIQLRGRRAMRRGAIAHAMAVLVIFLVCMLLPARALSDVVNVGDVASAGSLSTDPTPAPPVTTTPAPPPPVTTTPAPPPPVTTTPAPPPPVTTTPAPPPPVTTAPAPPPPVTTTPAPPPPTTTAPPATTTPAPPRTTSPAEAGVPPDEWTPAPTTVAPTTVAPTTKAPTTTTPAQTKAGSTAGLTSPGTGRATDNAADAGGSSEGSKYAIVIAAVVVLAVVLLASIYVVRRHRSKKEETAAELRRQLDQLDMELGESAYAMAKATDDVVAGQGQRQRHSGSGNDRGHSGSRGSHSQSSFPFQKLVPSPPSWSSSRTTTVSLGDRDSLSGVWRDPEILAARIPYEKLHFRDLLSRGGFGEVFRGVYHDRPVAIKRLLPENRRRMAALEDFLKEAQLLTMLEHERIVAFIGVAWDSPRDLCIVLEFMPKGDLRNLLSEWREQGRRTGWGDVRKVRIALHVAEALTYLHTLSSKVVHRDLKSKNVLLDDQWQAKLSDFGVSREESTHNTMTTNVGSSLWIAPEVMMGNNYDEKADIFSFGVVLTELDSHQLPYYNAMTPDGRKMPDAAVLHLVTMGKLQAEFSSMSRTDIVLLGRSCLALDPKQRPSAADLRFRLSQILGSY